MVINEIFRSIDGEVNSFHQGRMTTFVRIQGCNLHEHPCNWCDTKHALEIGKIHDYKHNFYAGLYTVKSALETITRFCGDSRNVTITGGEPFMDTHRNEVCDLIIELAFHKFYVNVETNGKCNIPKSIVPYIYSNQVCVVSDFKMPSSGNYNPVDVYNFFDCNFVKFVICTMKDLEVALDKAKAVIDVNRYGYHRKPKIVFSPVILNNKPDERILDSIITAMAHTDYILNVQIHKLIGLT